MENRLAVVVVKVAQEQQKPQEAKVISPDLAAVTCGHSTAEIPFHFARRNHPANCHPAEMVSRRNYFRVHGMRSYYSALSVTKQRRRSRVLGAVS